MQVMANLVRKCRNVKAFPPITPSRPVAFVAGSPQVTSHKVVHQREQAMVPTATQSHDEYEHTLHDGRSNLYRTVECDGFS